MSASPITIQLSATFTAEPLRAPLAFWLEQLGLEATIHFSGYGQVLQQALDPASESATNGPAGLNLFLVRPDDLAGDADGVVAATDELGDALAGLASRSSAPLLVVFCPHRHESAAAAEAERKLVDRLVEVANTEALTTAEWTDLHPVDEPFDPDADEAGAIPYTDPLFAALATVVARRLSARHRPPAKVLVLDADHTIWGGVCGEDGPARLAPGGPWGEVREFARAKRDEGFLLALCSKNHEADVARVFAERGDDLGLERTDFAGWKVDWRPKSENLRELAAELNLGLDSFVFLDDNPAEVAEVAANAPGVLALPLPERPHEVARFLRHLWALDPAPARTDEDTQRAEFYRRESERRRLAETAPSFEAFLRGLELEVGVRDAGEDDHARLSQLTRRTNQFNASGLRLSEAELAERLEAGERCLAVRVSDRFGDYGLVGAALHGEPTADGELPVEAFLLSCRAMGKGVERSMVQALADRARDLGAATLAIAFRDTERNEPCRRFLESAGAGYDGETGAFRLDVTAAADLPLVPVEPAKRKAAARAFAPEPPTAIMSPELATRIALQWSDPETLQARLDAERRPRPDLARAFVKPGTGTEKRLATIWCEILGLEEVGLDDPFTDLGGDSVDLVRVHSAIRHEIGVDLDLTELFELPTVAALARRIEHGDDAAGSPTRVLAEPPPPVPSDDGDNARSPEAATPPDDAVAIVGLSLRVPGAADPDTFWENLAGGVESISRFERDELAYPEEFDQPGFVPAKGILEDIDQFDASFFGILPKDARIMDPQQRIFLELAWEAMERAGYRPDAHRERIGVYAGAYFDTYLLANLCADRDFLSDLIPQIQVGSLQTELGNDKDYLATRVAFKLNLRGPAMTLQTACSTSLVAIVEACRAIRDGLCDMALAGGVTVTLPLRRGYFHTEQGMLSRDGHCRAFDERASGTVFGNGAGMVMLKRLSDAVRDRDAIHAVIRGAGLNNDGGVKHSYTAPSVEGQVDVVRMAQRDAGIDPRTISYVEAHGTGTPLGDPIEVSALTRAFREGGVTESGTCALGSLKTNIGHLDVASGVCGVIKTALSLEKGRLPPTLHFEKANPKIDFANSPFRVNAALATWEKGPGDTPRRAGVSSFGVGGTNAHVVLEEAPEIASVPSPRPAQLFLLSARTETALDTAGERLGSFARDPGNTDPADAAWTLATGRQPFRHRRAVVAADFPALAEALASGEGARGHADRNDPPVRFLFPGQGAQHPGMAREFYEAEPRFRATVDHCAEILRPRLGVDLTKVLFPPDDADAEAAAHRLRHTVLAQPALFVIEYALAELWRRWGVEPSAMVGHSVGEFVAACHAGVFDLEAGLELLAERGRLMGDLPGGGMLSVRLPEVELIDRLPDDIDLAAVNGPSLCVVSGPHDRLDAFAAELEADDIAARPLHTSHAFHSRMMDPAIDRFAACFEGIELRAPSIPILSTVTGEWLTEADATDPRYWAGHLRETVRFHDAVVALAGEEDAQLFLEVGPGRTLAGLVRQSVDRAAGHVALSTCRHVQDPGSDHAHAVGSLGALWTAGVEIDWEAFYGDEIRRRVVLPTYPFERQRHWIDPKPMTDHAAETLASETPTSEIPPAETPAPATRTVAIGDAVRAILADLSGIPETEMDGDAGFLELGFDSLLLTQVSKSFQDEFGAAITMRQLMADFPTIDALVAHLDATLPADRYRESSRETTLPHPDTLTLTLTPTRNPTLTPTLTPTRNPDLSPAPPTPASPPTPELSQPPNQTHSSPAPATAAESLIAQQLDLMRQQLAVLQGGGATPSPAAAPPPIPRPTASPSPTAAPASKSTPQPSSPPDSSAPSTAIDRSGDDTLTERQRQHLDELVSAYTAKTRTSKELTAKYRRWHADPRTVSGFNPLWKEMIYQIAVERSKGSRLLDVDGNEYIDLLNGFGPNFLGHSPDFVTGALHEQLDRGIEVGPQCVAAMEAAQLFCEVTGNERASFVNTGSEAVQAAMRLSRTVTGRDRIVVFARDYHGNFDEVLVRSVGSGDGRRSLPIAPGIPRRAVEDVLVLPYGADEALEIIRERAHELAAVIVEPIQSRRPEFQPAGFIREVREITRESGSLFVFDEVITGFRTGPRGAQEFYGVEADIATYGKVVGGGLPIGVVAGKAEYMDTFDGGAWQYGDDSVPEKGVTFFAGTFVRHPLAMAAAKQVLLHLREQGPDYWATIRGRADRLAGAVDRLFVENEAPVRLPNFGSQLFVRVAEGETFANLLFFHLRHKGVFLLEGFPSYLTAAHTEADVDYVVDAFRESIAEMQAGGFFPRPAAGLAAPLDGDRLAGPPRQLADEEAGDDGDVRGAGETSPGRQKSPDRVHPLTAPLAEVWLASQVSDAASLCYDELNAMPLSGPLDVAALELSLQDVVDRHEGLRMAFLPDGSGFRIRPEMPLELRRVDLAGESPDERERRKVACLDAERLRVYDLENEPLFRATLLRLGEDEHLLLLSAHHIACDGWSFNVINDELSRLYSARVRGDSTALPPPTLPFGAYAERRVREEFEAQGGPSERYWLERFAEPVPPLDFPLDRPRPETPDFRCDTVAEQLDPDTLQRLKRCAGRSGATLFGLLLAAYHALLHRVGRQDRIAVGFPAAAQNREGCEDVVGHAVNFVPFVLDLDPARPFSDFLKEAQGHLLDALEHQDYTYGQLLQKLDVERGAGRRPLVEAVFNLERLDGYGDFAGLETGCEEADRRHVANPIFLKATESNAGLELRFDFHTALFDADTVRNWLAGYVAGLEKAMAEPDAPLAAVASALSPEQEARLHRWNDTATDYPREATVPALFDEVAARLGGASLGGASLGGASLGGAIALRFPGGEMSYAGLADRADRVAHRLAEAGAAEAGAAEAGAAQPGEKIGLCLERSPELIAALLGILKTGGAYVPIDPDYPADRIRTMLADCGARRVVTRRSLRDRLPDEVECIAVEEALESGDAGRAPTEPVIAATDAAYVIYTSGSTGEPKGSVVPHRAIVRLVRDTNYCDFGEDEVILQAATPCFDASVYEIYGALLNGGTLLLPLAGRLTVERLAGCLREEGVTQLFLTTGLFQVMVDEAPDAFAGVRQVLTGGDLVSPDHMTRFLDAHPDCRLVHCYGPTENTTFSTCHDVTRDDLDKATVPIGRPIANSTAWVLDPEGRPLAPGVPGELHTGGDGVALGYRGRPELTAERFVPDPFDEEKNARLYRTGDLARYRPDGALEFLGRIDRQVKIRGFRVEPDEIEARLGEHPQVRQAKIVVRGSGAADKILVAYASPVADGGPTGHELLDWLRARLPDYLVPSAAVVLDELPLDANGKIDTRALPDPVEAAASPDAKHHAPARERTETETTLAAMWGELLAVPEPGLDDDFFALGGHSLLGMKLFARIQRTFGVNLPLATLFRASTIRQLAAVIDERRSNGVPKEGVADRGLPVPEESPSPHHFAGDRQETASHELAFRAPADRATPPVAPLAETTVAIQPRGDRPPLFGIHGGDGGVLFYRDLAARLGEERPFYAFECPALTGGGPIPEEPVEATAARYLAELRRVQPAGPYHLAGYSYGGVLAWEMACQLAEEGETVAFLGLFDTDNPAAAPRKLSPAERVATHWRRRNRADASVPERLGRLVVRVASGVLYRIGFELESLLARALPPSKRAGWLRQVQLRRAHERAMIAWTPRPFAGRLTLFRALTPCDKFALEEDYGWGSLVDEFEILEVPGDHESVFDEAHAPALAEAVRRSLGPEPERETETVSA